jgi:septal ring factor EnvC (AmiA/AmiB activator)
MGPGAPYSGRIEEGSPVVYNIGHSSHNCLTINTLHNMIIEGKKNLELTKRALLSHLVNCSVSAIRADDKQNNDYWDPEIEETKKMLDAVEKNLEQFKEGSAELALEHSSFSR